MFFICLFSFFPFFHICFFLEHVSSFKFLIVLFLSKKFHCWHQFQSLTVDVFSVVGAPWRCGVLTTYGGIAGVGPPAWESMIQLPKSEVEAPRL